MRAVDLQHLILHPAPDAYPGVTHVTLSGETFPGHAVRELYELAMAFDRADQPRLLVDLTGVASVTSGAMGMFVTVRKKFLSFGGQFHLAVPDPAVMEQFELMFLQRILSLHPSVDAALKAFKP